MKFVIASMAVGSIVLAGCATITVPVNRKVDAKTACGPLAKRGCAPTNGAPMALKQQYKTLELGPQNVPKVMNYLGMMVKRDNLSGEPGATCGGALTPPFGSPFKTTDMMAPSFSNTITLVYTLERTMSADIKADLTQAMVAAGVPTQITERVDADIDLSISQLKKVTVNATATFSEYQLKPEVLRELDGSVSSGRLSRCLAQLRTGDWRLYQAVSGLTVSEGRSDSGVTNTIVAGLAAKVKLLKPDVDTIGLTAKLKSVATQTVKTAVKPYFVVVGVSFYVSPVHSIIT